MNVCFIQARLSSSRLPGKCLMKISEHFITSYVIEAALKSNFINYVGVICPEEDYQEFNKIYGDKIFVFGGEKENVLKRYCDATMAISKKYNIQVKNVVRLTSDCPLLLYFHNVINDTISLHERYHFEYSNNIYANGFPSGLDVEVINAEVLLKLYIYLRDSNFDKKYFEHVTLYIRDNIKLYDTGHLIAPPGTNKDLKWSIDTIEDFEKVAAVINLLQIEKGPNFEKLGV